MIKKNIWKIVVSSLLTLLPIPICLILGTLLPEDTAVKIGLVGGASLMYYLLPAVMLGVHIICLALTARFGGAEQSPKVTEITFWIIPALSIYSLGMIFAIALGFAESVLALVLVLLGVMFVVIGNYLPKTTRNVAFGIKIKWTMANDDNWYATHRLGGRLFVIAGIVSLISALLPTIPAIILPTAALITLIAALPIYSYRFYKKQLAEGSATKEDYERGYAEIYSGNKAFFIAGIAVALVLVILIPFLLFTGNVEVELAEDSVTVDADFWSKTTVKYEDIDSVEYREDGVAGERVNGIASAKLLVGIFRSDALGVYTRYTCAKSTPCIVITTDGQTIVIGTADVSTTEEIYERLLAEISQ